MITVCAFPMDSILAIESKIVVRIRENIVNVRVIGKVKVVICENGRLRGDRSEGMRVEGDLLRLEIKDGRYG